VTRGRLAKRTPVRAIEGSLDIAPSIVRSGDDIVTVARQAMDHPQTRVLAVVDDDGRLVGLLPVVRVVEEIVAHTAPEALIAEISDLEGVERFGREVQARVAADLASPPVALRLDDTVGDALHRMQEHDYSGLPVVDDAGRVIGYVDLLELALRYLEDRPADVRSAHPPTPSAPET
jgi:CBS domain-containing protein